MIKATRFFFFDVDTSNCKAMISMFKATRFFLILSAPPVGVVESKKLLGPDCLGQIGENLLPGGLWWGNFVMVTSKTKTKLGG